MSYCECSLWQASAKKVETEKKKRESGTSARKPMSEARDSVSCSNCVLINKKHHCLPGGGNGDAAMALAGRID